jgi:hypothetical protein
MCINGWPFQSDSLPGVRSVIEAMESTGLVLSAISETVNTAPQARAIIGNQLPDAWNKNAAGLKTSAIATNPPLDDRSTE